MLHRTIFSVSSGSMLPTLARAQTRLPLRSPTQLSHTIQAVSSRTYTQWTTRKLPLQLTQRLPSTSASQISPLPRHATFRSFSSNPRFDYARNTYNRFGGARGPGPRRESVFGVLLRNAKPHHFVLIGLGVSGIYFYNTDVVEMTGRRRFNCISTEWELQMGEEGYAQVLNSERGKVLPDYHPLTQTVNRVLQRLIPQAPIEGADWKVHVIKDDDMANAFVLPGGKVFVYTGILPICGDEDGLAAVLGHEIAHVVAHHQAERMSTSIVSLGVALFVSVLFDVSGQLSGFLTNLMWELPNSRTQEAEADNIGLMMMSKACFNPEAAVKLWQRMQKQEKVSPPQFMSTHPSSYNREEAIRGWLAKAEAIYEDNGCSSIGSYLPSFHSTYRSQIGL